MDFFRISVLINLFSYCNGSETYLNYYANVFVTEKTVNKFNKYWNFLKLFPSTCTIHFSRQRHSWDDLYYSFLAYCTLNSDDIWCVIISTYASYDTNGLRYQNSTKWGSKEFEDLTPTFTETFWGKRYNGFCVAQVAINRLYSIDYPRDHSYFYSPENLKESKTILKYYTPNYILDQAYYEETENMAKKPYITTPFFYSSTIILFLYSEYRVFVNCITCDYDSFQSFFNHRNGLDLTKRSQLIPLPVEVSLKQISTLLDSLNFEKPSPKPYKFKIDPKKLQCLYEEFFMGTLELKLIFVEFDSCIKHLIFSSINHTGFALHDIIRASFSLQSYKEVNVNLLIVNHGATSFGIKYSVFIKRHLGQGGSQSIHSLLAPIDLQGWIVAVATVFGIRFLLKSSGFKGSLYWLFSTLLEQSDDQRKYLNKRNMSLVASWFILAFFLRIVYTSSMYTYMTQESEPKGVPSNFTELLYQTNMNLVFETSALRYLEDFAGNGNWGLDEGIFPFERLKNRIWDVSLLQHITSGLKVPRFACSSGRHSSNISNAASTCMSGERYAYLYSANIDLAKTFLKSALVKPYVMLQGVHHIFENNEFQLFSSHIFWVCSRKSYFQKRFSKALSYLEHSGIYRLQATYAQLRSYKQFEKEVIRDWEGTSSPVSSLTAMLNVWMKFECFYRYQEVCSSRYDLSGDSGESDVVHLNDLKIIWMMFYSNLLFCAVIFLSELLK